MIEERVNVDIPTKDFILSSRKSSRVLPLSPLTSVHRGPRHSHRALPSSCGSYPCDHCDCCHSHRALPWSYGSYPCHDCDCHHALQVLALSRLRPATVAIDSGPCLGLTGATLVTTAMSPCTSGRSGPALRTCPCRQSPPSAKCFRSSWGKSAPSARIRPPPSLLFHIGLAGLGCLEGSGHLNLGRLSHWS